VIKPGTLRQTRPVRHTHSINLALMAKVLAGVAVLVIIGLVIVGSIGGSDNGGDKGKEKAREGGTKAAGTAPPNAATTTTTPSDRVSVELRATATVWVCLVDERGTALVDSETLSADDSRGPFSSGGFEVTFGNGSVQMTVDGQPAPVPQAAEPLGYRITPSGVRKLDPSSQPTCT
jgi:hypothetical protein